jgi:hypothetical protein
MPPPPKGVSLYNLLLPVLFACADPLKCQYYERTASMQYHVVASGLTH